MFAQLLRDFGLIRVADMAGEGAMQSLLFCIIVHLPIEGTGLFGYANPLDHDRDVACAADVEEDPDKGVKEAFSEIRQVVTGQGDDEGVTYNLGTFPAMSCSILPCRDCCPKCVDR